MEQEPIDLRKKIARYRRSRAVMNDPATIEMIDRLIEETEEQIERNAARDRGRNPA